MREHQRLHGKQGRGAGYAASEGRQSRPDQSTAAAHGHRGNPDEEGRKQPGCSPKKKEAPPGEFRPDYPDEIYVRWVGGVLDALAWLKIQEGHRDQYAGDEACGRAQPVGSLLPTFERKRFPVLWI